MRQLWWVVTLGVCNVYGESYTLPKYFSVCYRDDPMVASCIKEKIETLLPRFKSGAREFDLDRIDPLDLHNLTFKFKTFLVGGSIVLPVANIQGLTKLRVIDVRPKLDDPKKFVLDFDADLDEFRMYARYEMDGYIDRFSVKNKGNLDMIFGGVKLTYHLEGELRQREGRDFLHLSIFRWRFRDNDNGGIDDFRVVNDDVVLDKPIINTLVKTVIRISWRAIARASLPAILPSVDDNLRNLFANFFLKYPFDVLFPQAKPESRTIR